MGYHKIFSNGAHHSEVMIKIPVDGEELVLNLHLNKHLLTADHTLQYQHNGETVNHKPTEEELELCHYSGSVRGKASSWAAVSTCTGVSAIIADGSRVMYIQPAQGSENQSWHYLYDHSDLNTEFGYGFDGVITNNTQYDPTLLARNQGQGEVTQNQVRRYKRQTEMSRIREQYNASEQSRYVELVFVVDNKEFNANGRCIINVRSKMIQLANVINSVFAPLNIYIALVGVVVWTYNDEIQVVEDSNITLHNFLEYRRTKLVTELAHDNAYLVTRQSFGNVIGKAMVRRMCTLSASGGIAAVHTTVTELVALTIAHEMGHNFGMNHDTDEDCECPDEKCIMSESSSSVVPAHWSACSLRSLMSSFAKGIDYCLRNKPNQLFNSPTCGNGFTEPGEQCDCGRLPGGDFSPGGDVSPCHACCDPNTCTLRHNATCGAGACCDLTTCRPKAAGTVCRAADRECDLPEFCSGHAEFCPKDIYKMDTTPCGKGDDEAYCVQGSCRSHNKQCQFLWGPASASSPQQCYTSVNVKGVNSTPGALSGGHVMPYPRPKYYPRHLGGQFEDDRHWWDGSCGYDPVKVAFKSCSPKDALCGVLQCTHFNELQIGMNYFLYSRILTSNNKIVFCHSALIDMGVSDVDPGLVPDGAKCGDGMMCLNQRCVPVDTIRARIAAMKTESFICPSNCSGNGVCNSEGQCHCLPGFAPPLCTGPGPGGSTHSGPADPGVPRIFTIAMYIIFLGIVPLISLFLLVVYFYGDNVFLIWLNKLRKSCLNCLKCCKHDNKSRFKNLFNRNNHNKGAEENRDESARTPSNIQSSVINSPTSVLLVKKPLQKPLTKIIKDDIQIATHDIQLKPVKTSMSSDVSKHLLQPKSDILKSKPNIVIVNKGLTSTTSSDKKSPIPVQIDTIALQKPIRKIVKDEIQIVIHDVKLKPVKAGVSSDVSKPILQPKPNRLHDVKLKPVKAGMSSDVSKPILQRKPDRLHDVKLKPVKAGMSSDVSKPLLQQKPDGLKSKPPTVIVNKGLTSTTNEMLKKGRWLNVGSDS